MEFITPSKPKVVSLEDKARYLLTVAVKEGIVIKPSECSKCGETYGIEGHHTDYNKPLDVVWLCHKCHKHTHLNSELQICQDSSNYKGEERTNKIFNVGIYTRISPNPDKEDTINQERELRNYAERQNWHVVEHYREIHVSGAKKGVNRKEFSRMMLDASKRKFDLLLFWGLDRLSREGVFETMQYLKQLNTWGVEYKSYTEPYLDSLGLFKDLVVAVMAIIAKQERIRIIERTKAGMETARLKGKAIGRPKAVVNIEEALAMRKNGTSLKKIGEEFGTSEATICRLLKGMFDRATY